VAHAAIALAPCKRPRALIRTGPDQVSVSAAGPPTRTHGPKDRSPYAGHHVPVRRVKRPGGDSSPDPAGAPRSCPGEVHGAGPEPVTVAPTGSEAQPAMQTRWQTLCGARAPRAPHLGPAVTRPGRPPASPWSSGAGGGGETPRRRVDSAPASSAGRAPPAAPRPAPSHLPRRPALFCQSTAPQSPLSDFHFLWLLKENQISCFARAGVPRPPPQLLLSVPGASPPPPPPALRSAPRAPPLRPRPRAAPASWLRRSRSARALPLTSPAAAAPRPRPARTCARRAPPPPRRGRPESARARDRDPCLCPRERVEDAAGSPTPVLPSLCTRRRTAGNAAHFPCLCLLPASDRLHPPLWLRSQGRLTVPKLPKLSPIHPVLAPLPRAAPGASALHLFRPFGLLNRFPDLCPFLVFLTLFHATSEDISPDCCQVLRAVLASPSRWGHAPLIPSKTLHCLSRHSDVFLAFILPLI
jgi:hypothetical protein